ncbi:SMP-30/gluconolactonase/LRE family protein [Dechloromonas denitrificans]|uniref:SMP-30/gluconolactonase/LRE family protein n=1 Tax=Dechloromonas denitrificans TaxID=281362 RepID=UPI001CF91DA6|nr:SMP-30/gluconolactonase/LRE family protein [Dechloromonas denitrificans]UCV01652.1 SMP-30/gluconolactonase/LRE family protein [Dechloromonas denitrificans]
MNIENQQKADGDCGIRPKHSRPLFAALLLCAGAIQAQEAVPTAIPGVVEAGTRIEFIRDGFKGTEGPVRLPDGSVIFTETQDSRITRIAADGSVSTYLENSNGSNGLGFSAYGELVSVQNREPRVGVIAPADKVRTLADSYEGVSFGRPNDIVVGRRAGIFFTDSGAAQKPDQPPVGKPAVYQITPGGALKRIANDIERPNGVQLSPDEKVLYVANTPGEYIIAYDLGNDGSIGQRRNFAKLAGYTKTDNGYSSGADGLAVDEKGRLYATSNAGIEVFSAKGDALGIIPTPKKPQNIAFAGKDKKTLYVVGRGSAYRIALLTPGFAGRAK